MVTRITKDNIDKIKNPLLKKDAEKYVKIYDEFLKAIENSGVEVVEKNDKESREELLRRLEEAGVHIRNNGKSAAWGRVSPSCEHCRTGCGSSTYILTLACNRDCFFCVNKNQMDYEENRKRINDVEAWFKNDIKRCKKMLSAALTGGEPLLYPEKCAEFIKKVKKTSKDIETRIYTNGDLASPEVLSLLKEAGLDEIRFGVKQAEDGTADEKILSNMAEAVKYIPRVMAEMPLVPGTLEKTGELMLLLDKLGVFGVNILEFLYPWVHPKEYSDHKYKITRRPYDILFNYTYAGGIPVAGSEMECLELLLFCASQKTRMGVHYCSLENKLTAQIYHHNSQVRLSEIEYFSKNDFFIKTVKGYGDDTGPIRERLEAGGCRHYIYNKSDGFIEFSPVHINLLKDINPELGLSYQAVDFDERGGKVLRELQIDLIEASRFDLVKI